MRRPIRLLTVLLALLTPAPAWAALGDTPVSLWGNSGLLLVPTTHVLSFNEMQVTGGYLGQATAPLLGFHTGLLEGLEVGVVYPTPQSAWGLSADAKFRLLKQSAQVPFSLAVGGHVLGATSPAAGYGLANQLYLMMGHDLQWAFTEGKPVTLVRAALGFGGNLAGAEVLGGLQIPVTQYGSIEAEYVGNRPSQNAMINVGVTVTPFPWLGIRVASLGDLATDILSREWFVGARFSWGVPASGNPFEDKPAAKGSGIPAPPVVSPPAPPTATPTAVPSKAPVATPAPSAAPSATPTPSASPSVAPANEGTVQGRVTSENKGVQRIPLQLVGGITRKTWSEADGSFKFPRVPVGTYKLKVDRDGWKPFEREVIVVAGTTEVKVPIVALPATLKGQVMYAQKGVGGITVSIEALGIATLTKDDGTFVLADLPAGTHTVTYHRKKELLDKTTLTLGQGETLARNLTLKAGDVPMPQKGLVRGKITDSAKAALSGARVMVEGKELTVMTISGPDGGFILRELPPGSYKLSISKTGYTTRLFALTVKAGQEAFHTIALTAGT